MLESVLLGVYAGECVIRCVSWECVIRCVCYKVCHHQVASELNIPFSKVSMGMYGELPHGGLHWICRATLKIMFCLFNYHGHGQINTHFFVTHHKIMNLYVFPFVESVSRVLWNKVRVQLFVVTCPHSSPVKMNPSRSVKEDFNTPPFLLQKLVKWFRLILKDMGFFSCSVFFFL